MKISATYKDVDGDKVDAELRGVAFYSTNEMYVNVVTSTEQGRLGENAIFHLRSNFAFQVYSYVVSIYSKLIICFRCLLNTFNYFNMPDYFKRSIDPRIDGKSSASH